MVDGVASFTYVPGTDEIIYVLTKQASTIFRRPVSEDAHEMLYSKLYGEKALCIDHSAEHYMIIFSETIQTSSKRHQLHYQRIPPKFEFVLWMRWDVLLNQC